MKIAFCTDFYFPQLSGVADSIGITSRQLKKQGHSVRIYTPRVGGVSAQADVAYFPARVFPGTQGNFMITLPFGVMDDMRVFNPEVIHTHTSSPVGMFALYAHHKLHVPLIGTEHSMLAAYLPYVKLDYALFRFLARKYESWFFNHCTYVTAPGGSILDELKAHGMKAPAGVISNPIPTDLFRPLANRPNLKQKWGVGKPTILLFGRIAVEKNLDFALGVIADVRRQCDAGVVVIGEGPYRKTLEQKVKEKGLEGRVQFMGILRGEELVEAINTADLYLITSASDTQSLTTLQAMACGLPVVGANAGGLPEYIQDGVTGFVVDLSERAAFTEHVVRLLQDPKLAVTFGATGRESVMKFSPEAIAKKFEVVYEQAIHTYENQPGHTGI